MQIRARLIVGLVVLAVAMTAGPPARAVAAKAAWNQIENVKGAARRLGVMQRRQGSEATLKFLEACYKTHMLAEKYTEGLESCMAQDYMLSQMLAVIYAKVPIEKLNAMKAPSSDVIARAMRGRFQSIFRQYKITQKQADNLKKAVDEYGMPAFIKIVFPNTDKKKDDALPDDENPAGPGAPSDAPGDGNGSDGSRIRIPTPEGETK